MTAESASKYFLPPNVHFGSRGDALVFLDLNRDNYILVNGASAALLRAAWESNGVESFDADVRQELLNLERSGLLTRDPARGALLSPTSISLPNDQLSDVVFAVTSTVTLRHLWHFTAACVTSIIKLRCYELRTIVAQVQARKKVNRSSSSDLHQAQALYSVFQTLRYFLPKNYLCLYDSLTLIEFLARFNLFPMWVFGIKLEPWSAHCWVQDSNIVFNETVDEAASYTPIMAI